MKKRVLALALTVALVLSTFAVAGIFSASAASSELTTFQSRAGSMTTKGVFGGTLNYTVASGVLGYGGLYVNTTTSDKQNYISPYGFPASNWTGKDGLQFSVYAPSANFKHTDMSISFVVRNGSDNATKVTFTAAQTVVPGSIQIMTFPFESFKAVANAYGESPGLATQGYNAGDAFRKTDLSKVTASITVQFANWNVSTVVGFELYLSDPYVYVTSGDMTVPTGSIATSPTSATDPTASTSPTTANPNPVTGKELFDFQNRAGETTKGGAFSGGALDYNTTSVLGGAGVHVVQSSCSTKQNTISPYKAAGGWDWSGAGLTFKVYTPNSGFKFFDDVVFSFAIRNGSDNSTKVTFEYKPTGLAGGTVQTLKIPYDSFKAKADDAYGSSPGLAAQGYTVGQGLRAESVAKITSSFGTAFNNWNISAANAAPFELYISNPHTYTNEDETTTTPKTVLYGDVDGSGGVTSFDALLVLQHVAKQVTLEGDALKAADVDGTVGISSFDALMILQYVAKQITVFPVESK